MIAKNNELDRQEQERIEYRKDLHPYLTMTGEETDAELDRMLDEWNRQHDLQAKERQSK